MKKELTRNLSVLGEAVRKRHEHYIENYKGLNRKLLSRLLGRFSRIDDLIDLLSRFSDQHNFDLIEDLFEELDFTYTVSQKDLSRIPADGPLLITANHPLGHLDGLALLQAVSNVRRDVFLYDDSYIWSSAEQLSDLTILFDDSFKAEEKPAYDHPVATALQKGKAVIVFPAIKSARSSINGPRDGRWSRSLVNLAVDNNVPVLPVHISGRNSFSYYLIEKMFPVFAEYVLTREITLQKSKELRLTIGNQIPAAALTALREKSAVQLLRKQVYALGKGKKGYFKTEKNIILPVDRKEIRSEVIASEKLGETNDGMLIVLARYNDSPATMREISRLREVTFRKVGEGTGQRLDTDEYDRYYDHLVLWDDRELEIVGAYRLADCSRVLPEYGVDALYSSTLFTFTDNFLENFAMKGIELGRSFVQQKYWNSNALDYLWHGIGAYLASRPEVKYLFGPVSISASYSREAVNMLVHFYSKWFPDEKGLASHKTPYVMSRNELDDMHRLFGEEDYKADFRALKSNLKHFGHAVPTLYKQYSELCEDNGVSFLDFGIDKDFGSCVDGMILVTVPAIKETKKNRYIYNKLENPEEWKTLVMS